MVGAKTSKKGYAEGNGYLVSWCFGHLVGLKYPNDYGIGWLDKWSFSQLPMIPEKWLFKIAENTKEQFEVLKALTSRNDVTELICATDADREGEMIFRYVYNMIGSNKPVKRLWVSSLEESAIRSALSKMKSLSDYDNLFSAGFSRTKADWLVGMNGSRLFSCRYHDRLDLGRVQMPTLAMIVNVIMKSKTLSDKSILPPILTAEISSCHLQELMMKMSLIRLFQPATEIRLSYLPLSVR